MYSDLPAVEWLLTNLDEAVHRLASPAAIQTSWVEENQFATDELALELEGGSSPALPRHLSLLGMTPAFRRARIANA
jgi:hypothetical protein